MNTHILIIGGGVMGASTLYHLAKRGVNDVVLLEKESFFGQGATGRCAGGIRYQFATEINIRLSLLSLPMLDRFKDEIGQDIDRRYCGYLFLLNNEKDVAAFKRNVQLQHSLGVMTEWLSGDEIRQRLPLMRLDDVIGGTFYQQDGLCDPNGVVMGYINAARRLGAKAVEDSEVIAVEKLGDKGLDLRKTRQRHCEERSLRRSNLKRDRDCFVKNTRNDVSSSMRVSPEGFKVHTANGDITCEILVNAAGPWSAPLSRMIGIDLPVTPLRRQMLTTTPLPQVPPDFPFVIDFAQSLYFHREGDGLLSGMSNPNEKAGFDQSVDEAFELINLEAASKRMPLLEKAGLASHWAGLYEVTPDAHPIIGRVSENYFVIAGFSGHGFMHGPASGLLLSEEILDGKAHTLDISSLSYARFAERKLIKEYNVV